MRSGSSCPRSHMLVTGVTAVAATAAAIIVAVVQAVSWTAGPGGGQRTESWTGARLPDTVGTQDDGGGSHRATAEPGVMDALVHRGGANHRREQQGVGGKIASRDFTSARQPTLAGINLCRSVVRLALQGAECGGRTCLLPVPNRGWAEWELAGAHVGAGFPGRA
jgi:hypothetical protein